MFILCQWVIGGVEYRHCSLGRRQTCHHAAAVVYASCVHDYSINYCTPKFTIELIVMQRQR